MNNIFESIKEERKRQDEKWGPSSHHPMEWSSILMEEVGEVSKEVNDYTFNSKDSTEMKKELIQVAAVVVAWLEDIESKCG